MKFVSWIKDAVVTLVDPDREERLRQQSSAVQSELKRSWGRFDLSSVQESLQIPDREMKELAERVFRNVIQNGWKDGFLAEDEKQT